MRPHQLTAGCACICQSCVCCAACAPHLLLSSSPPRDDCAVGTWTPSTPAQSHAAASCAGASVLHPQIQLKEASTALRPRPTCTAPMVNYWSQVCTAQFTRPLPQIRQALYGGGIFAVSAVVHVCCERALRVLLMHRAGCFVRVCCGVQRDVVCAVGEAAGSDAA